MIVIPETQSREKKDMLRLCGAELGEVPAVAYANPNNYQHVGRRLANELRMTEPNGVLFRPLHLGARRGFRHPTDATSAARSSIRIRRSSGWHV